MEKLIEQLNELESKISESDKLNLSVSKSSVGWHIEHTVLATNKIIESLNNSKPQEYKWNFKFLRMLVFGRKKIPRGKGKAPETVIPKGDVSVKKLNEKIQITKSKIKELKNIDQNSFIVHPVFGNLNLKSTIKFLEIHSNHHIEIINDILKN